MEESPVQPSEIQGTPLQQSAETPPPEKPSRFTKRVKILIAIVLTILILLIAGVAGAYWYTTSNQTPSQEKVEDTMTPTLTPDPTADWNTYKGNNYTFKYPNSWKFYSSDEPTGTTDVNGIGEYHLSPIDINNSYIMLQVTSSEDTLLKLVEESIKNYSWTDKVISTTKINNIEATKVTGQENGAERIAVVFEMGNFVYKLQSLEESVNLFDQILSTFKFTDSGTASDESSDLNTYSNDSLTFEYPNSLTLEYGFITGENSTIQIYSATSSEPLSNECMELVRTENKKDLKIKYYNKIVSNSGFACSDPDGTPREIWITGENGFAPGTVISYSVTEETEALKIFDQIISTFKFTDSNNN